MKFIKRWLWFRIPVVKRDDFSGKCILLGRVLDKLSGTTHRSAMDLQLMTCLVVRSVQQSVFCDDKLSRSDRNRLKQLNVKMDDIGILRCHGRLDKSYSNDSKPPALLPTHHTLSHLIIEKVHCGLMHAGVAHTLAQLRCNFWIPKGRREVAHVLKKCVTCRRMEGPAFQLPTMPPLPVERVARSAPFQYVGLDYFGPLYVSGSVSKVWICLFTCLAIRAVHLEWVSSLSTLDFISCLRRFIARRGVPTMLYSDNAAQFKLAATTINNAWRTVFHDPSLTSYLATHNIQWKFAAALAPWQGGVYERLVGLIKRALAEICWP